MVPQPYVGAAVVFVDEPRSGGLNRPTLTDTLASQANVYRIAGTLVEDADAGVLEGGLDRQDGESECGGRRVAKIFSKNNPMQSTFFP
jgi:hypothetical protein